MSSMKTLILLCSGLLISSFTLPAQAATFTVDRTDDIAIGACTIAPNDCALRGAINKANTTATADVINFDTTLFAMPKTISLGSALRHLIYDVTITGPGADVVTVKGGIANRAFSIFTVDTGVSATISGLTLSNGSNGIYNGGGTVTATGCTLSGNGTGIKNNSATVTATGCSLSGNGTGILNDNKGTATAANCTLNGNYYGIRNDGGTVTTTNCTLSGNINYGIYSIGVKLTAINCTLSDNETGLFNDAGTVTATNCTLSGNHFYGIGNYLGTVTATNCTLSGNDNGIVSSGGTVTATNCTLSGNNYGIYNDVSTITLKNTLVVGNPTNVDGAFTDGGYNITSGTAADAGLDPAGLQDNGGPTKTIALLPGSPAIDAGNSTLTTDQRGYKRPYDDPAVVNATGGNGSDIGAFELFVLGISVNDPRSLPEGSADISGSVTFDITLNGPSTQSVTVNYQTRDGINSPATAGVDYVEKHGKLTFAPGEILKRVTIFFIGDSKAEPNETFFLDLKTPTNAAIADGRGVGTIANDDATPLLFENDDPSE